MAGLDPAIRPASQPAGTLRGWDARVDGKPTIHFESGSQMYGSVLSSRGSNMWLLLNVFPPSALRLRCYRSKTDGYISRLGRFLSRLGGFISRLGRGKFPVRPATGIGAQALDLTYDFCSKTAPAGRNPRFFPWNREFG